MGDLTAISKPLHPDNIHQTIVQPASPPDLRIPNDVKLPNLSLGALAAPKKPTFDLSIKKPIQENASFRRKSRPLWLKQMPTIPSQPRFSPRMLSQSCQFLQPAGKSQAVRASWDEGSLRT